LISTSAARFCAASDTRVSDSGIEIAAAMPVVAGVAGASEAFAMRGLASIAAIALRRAVEAAIGVTSAPSASRKRRIARACNCETRDSLTPNSAPMSFMVTSL